MELCNEGSLKTYTMNKGKLKLETAIDFFKKLIIGYKELRE